MILNRFLSFLFAADVSVDRYSILYPTKLLFSNLLRKSAIFGSDVSNNNPFTSDDNDPKTFDTLEEAAKEADEWNTGMVVELSYDKSNLH